MGISRKWLERELDRRKHNVEELAHFIRTHKKEAGVGTMLAGLFAVSPPTFVLASPAIVGAIGLTSLRKMAKELKELEKEEKVRKKLRKIM